MCLPVPAWQRAAQAAAYSGPLQSDRLLIPARCCRQHRITGVGGSASIESFTLPSLSFRLGGVDVTLKPANILLEENNSTSAWFKGNLGMDLLNQARSVDVDFGSMTLSLK